MRNVSRLLMLFAMFQTLILCAEKSVNDLKILILIIDSNNHPAYKHLRNIWRSYMHSDPQHFESYFIRGRADLAESFIIKEDSIWSRTKDSWIPGILNKTVLSLELMYPRLNEEFDYVVRTNLSSFYILPRLLEYAKTLPRTECYRGFMGVVDGMDFVGGAGIILSADLARMLVEAKDELVGNITHADDVVIASFFKKKGIPATFHPRMDFLSIELWDSLKDQIPDDIFHFRVKNNSNHLRTTHEIFIQNELLKRFYPKN